MGNRYASASEPRLGRFDRFYPKRFFIIGIAVVIIYGDFLIFLYILYRNKFDHVIDDQFFISGVRLVGMIIERSEPQTYGDLFFVLAPHEIVIY